MPIEDENVDPIYQKMVAAWEGDRETWGRINRALRDAMVDHAVRSCAYYRKVVPSTGGFRDIPILTKEIVREHLDDLLATGIPKARRVFAQSSGSTGTPLGFFRDTSQGPAEYVSAQRFLKRLHGITDDMNQVWLSFRTPAARPDGGPLRRPRRLLAPRGSGSSIHPVRLSALTSRRIRREVSAWQALAPYFLYGHASAISRIADEVEESGAPLPVPPTSVVTSVDTLTPEMAGRIGRVLRAPVHSWYGSREFNGYVAGTLPGTRRYVFNPLLVHMEIVDEAGRRALPGETGRLVLTDLNNYVMPFVRYDTGDLAVASDTSRGGWPAIEDLVGRSSHVLRLPSGKIINPAGVTYALFSRGGLHPYVRFGQCAQTDENRLELRIVWRIPPTDAVRSRVLEAFQHIADPDTMVSLVDVEEPERAPSGKVWLVRPA